MKDSLQTREGELPLLPGRTSFESDAKLGGRRFYDIPAAAGDGDRDGDRVGDARRGPADDEKAEEEAGGFLRYIADNVVGKDATFSGPFGRRKVVYADYTASGRALSFVEKYIYQVNRFVNFRV